MRKEDIRIINPYNQYIWITNPNGRNGRSRLQIFFISNDCNMKSRIQEDFHVWFGSAEVKFPCVIRLLALWMSQ